MQLAGTIVLLTPLLISFATAREVLDISKQPPITSPRGPSTARGSGAFVSGADAARELAIGLRLVSITPSEPQYGTDVTFAVEVTNRGTESLLFPWTFDPSLREDAKGDPVQATISLTAASGAGELVHIVTNRIYGTQKIETTVKRLSPGQSVIIRGRGSFQLADSHMVPPLLAELPVRKEVKASLTYSFGVPSRLFRPSVSENVLPVMLTKREGKPGAAAISMIRMRQVPLPCH